MAVSTILKVGGIISSVDRRVDKKGNPWAIVTIEDQHSAQAELLVFSRVYGMVAPMIAEDNIILAQAEVSVRDGRMSLFCNDLRQAELTVGEEGEVKLTLTNPCTATDIEDLELKISDEAGHILPRNAEKMYLGSLPVGESVTVTYPVTVVQKATVVPHMLKMEMTWNAADAEATYECSNTVDVHQPIRQP